MKNKIKTDKEIKSELKHYMFPRISIFIILVGSITIFNSIQKEKFILTSIISICVIFFILLNLIIYKIYPQLILFNSFFIYIVIFISINIFNLYLGGFISDTITFFYLCILLGFTLFGSRIGIVLSIINISSVIIYYIILKLGGVFPIVSNTKLFHDYRFINFMTISTIIMYIVWQYEKRNKNITNKLLEMNEQLSHDAFHDKLTKLPNRNYLIKQLEGIITTCNRRNIDKAKRSGSIKFALLFIDLDDFKKINDTYGHIIGDEVLKIVSSRLMKIIRMDDFIARLGGDEFIILLNDINKYEDINIIINKIIEELKRPLEIDTLKLIITASIGTAFNNYKFESPEEIIKQADKAMYQAKSKGKGQFVTYSDQFK